ncbi:LytR/AlgR family response regulator transcription factor [Chitinophaga sp. NPDC101104]|uniref:LytR/AlgR family response regulator transcription factor n=1 Tax=Chitinophaga sp. NPDC101104 TaxID=3390561 RepID=UPI003CFCC37C
MKLQCLVVDDEPLARQGLREYIADVSFLEWAGECGSAPEAADFLHRQPVDLLFLDIRLPRLSGLEFLRTLPQKPLTVITTAYPDHALEGFELDVLDYLLKPVSFERFLKAVNKAKAQLKAEPPDHFYIKCEHRIEKIRLADVLVVEALQNYIAVHTAQRKYITYLTFRAVEEYLPAEQFIKVHKSYIVAASKIDSIEGNTISVGAHEVPVSRALRDEVMEKILQNRYLKR